MQRLSGRFTSKMVKSAVKTMLANPGDYESAGLGLTGFVRTAIQNEINRQAKGRA